MSQETPAREPLDPLQSAILDDLVLMPDRPDDTWFVTKDAGHMILAQLNVHTDGVTIIGNGTIANPLVAVGVQVPDRVTFESGTQLGIFNTQLEVYSTYFSTIEANPIGTSSTAEFSETEPRTQYPFSDACTVRRVRLGIGQNTLTVPCEVVLRKNGVDTTTTITIAPGVTGYLTVVSSEQFSPTDLISYRVTKLGALNTQRVLMTISTEVERSTAVPLPSATPVNGIEYLGQDWGLGGSLIQDTVIDQGTFNLDIQRSTSTGGLSGISSSSVMLGQPAEGISLYNTNTLGFTSYEYEIDGMQSAGVSDITGTLPELSTVIRSASTDSASNTSLIITNGREIVNTNTSNLAVLESSNVVRNIPAGTITTIVQSADTISTYIVNGATSNIHQITSTDLQISSYPETRDDSTNTTPVNFIYTDVDGVFKSAPVTLITPILPLKTKELFTLVSATSVTLSNIPNFIFSVRKNGKELAETLEWSYASGNINFVNPLVMDTIEVVYEY